MDHYAVLGHPVAHSRSPFIHAQFARQTGQRLAYGRVLAPLDGFEGTLRRFAAHGLEEAGLAPGRAAGCNITVPFKFEVIALAARCSERAALAGAANVLRFDADGWTADNTDGVGLVRDLERHAATPLAGRRVLMIGAGGASAGALGPLLDAAPAAVVLANRSLGKAEALASRHLTLAQRCGVRLTVAPLEAPGSGFDVVINATSSSLAGAGVPVPASVLGPGALALDMMYGAGAQDFLDWARRHGARARDGLGMLVEQAAESFALWRGVMPDTVPVLHALRAQLDAAGGAPR